MALVILKDCGNNFEAELIKGALASEGIPCVINGENMNLIYGGITAMPIKILVNEEDLEKATAILEQTEESNE